MDQNTEKKQDETCQICYADPCDCEDLFQPYREIQKNNITDLRYQITNLLDLIDMAKHQLDYANLLMDESKKRLDSSISDFIVDSDESDRNDLVRYLYWKTDMSPTSIGELIDVNKERIYGIAGPLPIQMNCEICQRTYVSTIRSRNEQPSKTCASCEAVKIRKEHDIWMNQWTKTPMNSPVNYASYLSSHAWKKTARKMREKAGFKCQLCGANDKPLNVHHNSYERLGRERDDDLVVLCEPCHHRFHNQSSST